MTLTKISERQVVATSSSGDWIGRPSLLKDGSQWVMVYRAANVHAFDGNSKVHVRFSADEGATWTNENTYTNGNPVSGAPFDGDGTNEANIPTIAKAPNGDLLILVSEREQVYTHISTSQWRSTDGGLTWIDEGVVCNTAAINCEAISIGADMYAVGYADDPTRPGGGTKDQLWKSTDNGVSWLVVCDITQWSTEDVNVDECSIVNPSGSVLVVMMRARGAVMESYVRISPDLGTSWGDVLDITSQVRIIQRPRLHVFPGDPYIYMTGRDYVYDALRTVVSYSSDGGVTWIDPLELEETAQIDGGYSDFTRRADGNLYIVSYRGNYGTATLYEYIVQTDIPAVDYKQVAIDAALEIKQQTRILLDALYLIQP